MRVLLLVSLIACCASGPQEQLDQTALDGGAATSCSDGTCGWANVLEREQPHWLHRCNIQRRSWPLKDGMLSTASREPYIVTAPDGRNSLLSSQIERDQLLADMGDMDCTPSQAGNVRRGIHEMRLRDYIEDWMLREVQRDPAQNRYVFGEFGEEWAPLRDAYVLPSCRACQADRVAITIGLGGLHSGAPWHFHDAAFVEVLHGKKHFAFLPPGDEAVPLIDEAIKNVSQLHWYLEERPRLEKTGHLGALQECSIGPGEILFFPHHWHHGVVNLDAYTAFVSTFLDAQARYDV